LIHASSSLQFDWFRWQRRIEQRDHGNIILTTVKRWLGSVGYYGGLTMTHHCWQEASPIDAGDNSVAVAYALDNDDEARATTESWTVITTQICASILEPLNWRLTNSTRSDED